MGLPSNVTTPDTLANCGPPPHPASPSAARPIQPMTSLRPGFISGPPRRGQLTWATSPPAMVAIWDSTLMSTLYEMNRTDPSHRPKFNPLVWLLPKARLHGLSPPSPGTPQQP